MLKVNWARRLLAPCALAAAGFKELLSLHFRRSWVGTVDRVDTKAVD